MNDEVSAPLHSCQNDFNLSSLSSRDDAMYLDDSREHFPCCNTPSLALTAILAAQSLWRYSSTPKGRKYSPLFSLLTFPLVRSASQFNGDVVAVQAGFTLLAALEAASPPAVVGSNTGELCWSMAPRDGFSPGKDVCKCKRRIRCKIKIDIFLFLHLCP